VLDGVALPIFAAPFDSVIPTQLSTVTDKAATRGLLL
jgi:hypothetical protein